MMILVAHTVAHYSVSLMVLFLDNELSILFTATIGGGFLNHLCLALVVGSGRYSDPASTFPLRIIAQNSS